MPNTAITGLATFTTFATSDLVEIVDVSDTTLASTGTNKKVPFQTLLGMAPFVASGASHSGGAVPDPGATAGTAKLLREDGTWVAPVGVASGGTGLATLTAHGVMLGEGTSSPGFATIGTVGNILTDNGSGADPSFKINPVSSSQLAVFATGPYSLATTYSNIGLSLTLAPGTYIIQAAVRAFAQLTGPVNSVLVISGQFYDSTAAAVAPNSEAMITEACVQSASATVANQGTSMMNAMYTVSVTSVINLQAQYSTVGGPTVLSAQIFSNAGGRTTLLAIRIA